MTEPEYPACEHYAEVEPSREAIIGFIRFLRRQEWEVSRPAPVEIGPPRDHVESLSQGLARMLPGRVHIPDSEIARLADHFLGIDRDELEKERRAMLRAHR